MEVVLVASAVISVALFILAAVSRVFSREKPEAEAFSCAPVVFEGITFDPTDTAAMGIEEQ